jgi:hypothetical protein
MPSSICHPPLVHHRPRPLATMNPPAPNPMTSSSVSSPHRCGQPRHPRLWWGLALTSGATASRVVPVTGELARRGVPIFSLLSMATATTRLGQTLASTRTRGADRPCRNKRCIGLSGFRGTSKLWPGWHVWEPHNPRTTRQLVGLQHNSILGSFSFLSVVSFFRFNFFPKILIFFYENYFFFKIWIF